MAAGEEARLYRGGTPYVNAGAGLAQAVAFAEAMVAEAGSDSSVRGLGQLSAKKPGASDEQPGAVSLAAHSVRVRIAGAMARTEIDEVFENATDDVLEGIYRFPIPPDAKIERLALEVDGKLTDGAFVDRDRAAAIWRGAIVHAEPSARQQMVDDIVWVPGPWRDPALLEWQRGGRFELKIFPIPKRGQRRIVLAYTQVVAPQGGLYRYDYPLPIDPGGTTKIRHFDFDLELRGHDPNAGVRAIGYAAKSAEQGGVSTLELHADAFSPNGDLALEWARAGGDSELSAFGYRDPNNQDRYAAIALRPKLPRTRDDRAHATAIIVDSSRSMYGEAFDRARRLAVRLARELDPAGQLTVLACDSRCASMPAGLLSPGPLASQRVKQFLDGVSADGASDPTLAVYAADSALISAGPRLHDVVYIGDGTPTVGPIRQRTVSAAIEQSVRSRVIAVAIGAGADTSTLAAMARAGGGISLPYSPGQTLSEATLGVISASYGSALRDVRVELPSGLNAVAPSELDTIAAGSETFLTARMD
ncbi:MAG TPA: VIT and VWA domain-containing protein, partial [Gemmatimonadaceae bacterium]